MRYNHAYTLAFTVENENEDGSATNEELIKAVEERLASIRLHGGDEMQEACQPPFDSYEVEED